MAASGDCFVQLPENSKIFVAAKEVTLKENKTFFLLHHVHLFLETESGILLFDVL
jgi:hypothetical protein